MLPSSSTLLISIWLSPQITNLLLFCVSPFASWPRSFSPSPQTLPSESIKYTWLYPAEITSMFEGAESMIVATDIRSFVAGSLPSCPELLSPQPYTVDLLVLSANVSVLTAYEEYWPAAISDTSTKYSFSLILTCTALLAAFLLLPIWPYVLSPYAQTLLSSSRISKWSLPAAILTADISLLFFFIETFCGLPDSSIFHTIPPAVRAYIPLICATPVRFGIWAIFLELYTNISPNPYTNPSFVRTRTLLSVTDTLLTFVITFPLGPVTATGITDLAAVVPPPSWPNVLSPHA